MLSDRIETLRSRHENLEQELDKEHSRPLPNPSTIRELKRRKLLIKDEMSRLQSPH